MIELVKNGICCNKLINSHIFNFQIDFDEWPANHTCDKKVITCYNGSFFDLRYKYQNIFPNYPLEEFADDLEEVVDIKGKSQKKRNRDFKIKYSINCLPIVDEYLYVDENGIKKFIHEGKSFV